MAVCLAGPQQRAAMNLLFHHPVLTLLPALLCLNSCTLIGLKTEVETLEQQGAVTVQVQPPPRTDAPTYALAWRMEGAAPKDSAGFQRLRPDGIAAFSLQMNNVYRIGAFTDENRNRALDAGEPFGMQKDVRPVSLSDPSSTSKIWTLTLSRDHGLAAGTVIQAPKENQELGGKLNLALGDVVSLDEPRFAQDAGSGGLWRPLDFLSSNTMGLYFTEPYDPKRIPLILVYGIGGSPQDWRYFIDNFDRSRHQLWFFHYPSGMRLNRVSNALATSLRVLKQRHRFTTCHVVAHSMGGLVARTALVDAVAQEGVNFIPTLITVSTPWGGHQAAESGIRHLKKPVPSWLDVTPNSPFLTTLYATPLPRGTTHHLIYGSIEKGPFWLKEPNDGVVTISSETDLRVKRSTTSVRHLFHEHVEILNQPETLRIIGSHLSPGTATSP
jgi:pimeloyl-ACP methyl ester carboxylesterase